jgi:alpha-D-ribose 1-methylphosphonate 5-triphosphate synthase subunit PhnI
MFKRSKPPPPAATVATDPVEQTGQVLEIVNHEKHIVAESDDSVEAKADATQQEKKPPTASLGNYFRVLSYGTKFDAFLMGLSCLTSIGAGIAMPLMNIVLGR